MLGSRISAGTLAATALTTALVAPAHATPSTVVWAPATPAVQGFGVLHLTYDTYPASGGLYPIDLGLTVGLLPWQGLQLEVGADVLYPTFDGEEDMPLPIYFNGKLGAPQDVYFRGQPAWSAGIYNASVESDVTDYNVAYAVLGYGLPWFGTLAVGGYLGLSDTLLVDRAGDEATSGLLASYTSPSVALGAAGVGLGLYFTPAVALVTGPVFFFEPEVQPGASDWMWTAQLDVDRDLRAVSP